MIYIFAMQVCSLYVPLHLPEKNEQSNEIKSKRWLSAETNHSLGNKALSGFVSTYQQQWADGSGELQGARPISCLHHIFVPADDDISLARPIELRMPN